MRIGQNKGAGVLTKLEIKGFRGFEHFTIDNLKRVNLLVGDNNSGKTALLEAVEMLVGYRDLESTLRSAQRRYSNALSGQQLIELGVLDYFRREDTERGNQIEIGGWFGETPPWARVNQSMCLLWIQHFRSNRIPEGLLLSDQQLEGSGGTHAFPSDEIRVRRMDGSQEDYTYQASLRGHLIFSGNVASQNTSEDEPRELPQRFHCLFHPTEGVRVNHLGRYLSLLDGDEPGLKVCTDLAQCIEPRIRDVGGPKFDSTADLHLPIVLVEGSQGRIPLSHFGDGVRRAISIGAMAALLLPGGVLLIDEIESGLHYSRMPEFWRVLMHTCRERDLQLFATTHSEDCIKALAEVCEEDRLTNEDVAMFRLEAGRSHPVFYTRNRIIAAEYDAIEVRG